nr:MAG TPA: hypothetical protein [Caudoviricetes sp.]
MILLYFISFICYFISNRICIRLKIFNIFIRLKVFIR